MSKFKERTQVPPALSQADNTPLGSTLDHGDRSEHPSASPADSFAHRSGATRDGSQRGGRS